MGITVSYSVEEGSFHILCRHFAQCLSHKREEEKVLPREEEQKKSRQLKFFPKRKNKALKSSFY